MSTSEYTLKPILLAIYVLLAEIFSLLNRLFKWIYSKIKWAFSKAYKTLKRFFWHLLIAFLAFNAGAIYNDFYEHYRFYIFRTGSGEKRHALPAMPRKIQANNASVIACLSKGIA